MLGLLKELCSYIQNEHSNQQFAKLTSKFSLRQREMLDLINSGSDPDDDQILLAVYGTAESLAAYEKVKQRLYFDLIQTFFVPTQARSLKDFDLYRNKSIEYTALAKMISATPCRLNAQHLIREGLKFSKKSGLTENIVELLKIQLNIYGTVKQDQYNFRKTYEEYRIYEELSRQESQLQLTYWQIYSTTKSNNPNFEIEDGFIPSLLMHIENKESIKLTVFSFYILALLSELNNDYHELFRLSESAMDYFENMPFDSTRLKLNFFRRKYTASLKLKKYNVLREVFDDYFDQIPKYSGNWYMLKCYDTILLIHNKKYTQAVKNMPNALQFAKGVSENIIEFYKLVQGYAKVLSNMMETGENSKKFRIFKLMNELPVHSQDKAGINIAILVLQIVYFIDKKKYDSIIERVDALKQYSYRHLKKQKGFRSNCFIKMIIQMSRANFHPVRTERYVDKIWQRLRSVPLELSEQPLEVEIIPYEDLWEIVMTLLERNSKIKRTGSKT